jgi:predicted Fe-Mo cluster-binding NifX family protein
MLFIKLKMAQGLLYHLFGSCSGMKVALTVWEKRISPVFDSAAMLLIAEIENSEVTAKYTEPFNPEMPSQLAMSLNVQDVDTLICGAISEVPADMIEAEGIKLIPFISGDVYEILNFYAKGIPIVPEFLMPGCGRGQRKCKKRDTLSGRKKEVNNVAQTNIPLTMGKNPGRCKGRKMVGKKCKGSGQDSPDWSKGINVFKDH